MTDTIRTDNSAVIETAHKEILRLRDENTALQDKLAAMTKNRDEWRSEWEAYAMALRECLRDFATNYDHDNDAHKYGTLCRECEATKALALPMPRKI